MKSFRGTFLSQVIAAATAIEARANMREVKARHQIDRAIGPKGVERARKALRSLKETRTLKTECELREAVEKLLSRKMMKEAILTDGIPPVSDHVDEVFREARKVMAMLMR